MDVTSKRRQANYDRVMSRVYSKTRVNSKPNFSVTRHESTSARVGGKPSVLNASSSVISDLPLVLDDYVPEEKSPKRTFVVKPKRTLKSLDPVKPVASVPVPKLRGVRGRGRNVRVPVSMPSILDPETVGWSESHVRQCYSSRSHANLQELKSEIKEYKAKEDLSKLRSRLHKRCGVLLDDDGQVAADKAVQAEGLDSPSSNNSHVAVRAPRGSGAGTASSRMWVDERFRVVEQSYTGAQPTAHNRMQM